MSEPKPMMREILGTMTIGKSGHPMARLHMTEEAKSMLDRFQSYDGYIVDTVRIYGDGTSDEYIGQLDWPARGIMMDNKLYPTADLRKGLLNSVSALKSDKITTWYLHGPDRSIPYEVTLREVDKLYKEGRFERYGLCNYQAWEVAEIRQICERNGLIKPSVYQGLYNAFHRAVESELFPCLRRYDISFYCFNPLAVGLLTDRYSRAMNEVEKGSRFDASSDHGKLHVDRYFSTSYFDALEILRAATQKHGLFEVDCALGWLSHHSKLDADKGDGIVLGASNTTQLEQNLKALRKGPLPGEVVQALEDGWQRIRGTELKYWH